jgi:Ca2+/Na+ antiporter
MNEKIEATINALAAIFVIFVALLDPRISVALAVIFLIALSLYKFYFADRKRFR